MPKMPRPRKKTTPKHLSAKELRKLAKHDHAKPQFWINILMEGLEWSFYFIVVLLMFSILRPLWEPMLRVLRFLIWGDS